MNMKANKNNLGDGVSIRFKTLLIVGLVLTVSVIILHQLVSFQQLSSYR
jgi:hypothetical protein